MTIQKDKVVTMHYHLTNSDDGQVLDSSQGNEPLTYLHGTGSIIPGLERQLNGLDVGATKTGGVPCHHFPSPLILKIAKCRCGVSRGAFPVVPT
jgi:FKBP-type peptidyl-prolyl cis-trans isomerase 2